LAGPSGKPDPTAAHKLRLDKWLWQARFVKTRALAVALVASGHLRVNGQRIDKPGRAVGPGDVLTLVAGGQVRLLRILACGTRRGPAPEAATLYLDLEAFGSGQGTADA
jgi:ribosome-associated heat shock protein Hsp15